MNITLTKKKSNFSTVTKSSAITFLKNQKPKSRKHYNIPAAIMTNELINTFVIMKSVEATKDDLIPLPNKIFAWDIESFYKRRLITDSYYLDVLRKKPQMKLEISKFESDMKTLIMFLWDIIDCLMKNNYERVLSHVKSFMENEQIYNDIVSFYEYALPSLGNLKYRVLILDARKKALAQKLHEKLILKLEIATDVLLSIGLLFR